MFTRRRFLSLLGIGAAGLPLATFARKAPAPHVRPQPGIVTVEIRKGDRGRFMKINEALVDDSPEATAHLIARQIDLLK